MKKTIIGTLKKHLTIDGDRITLEGKHWTDWATNNENPTFLISDIKSIEWKPKQTLMEKPNMYFNVTGTDKKTDGFGNRSNDPYAFYFNKKQVDEVTEVYDYIMDRKLQMQSNSGTSADDIPSQIKKLSELKDAGILTDAEFISKKKELLDKM